MAYSGLSTASRFSVLKLEDEDNRPRKGQAKKPAPVGDKKNPAPTKKPVKPNNNTIDNELRSLAFGIKLKKQPANSAKVAAPAKPQQQKTQQQQPQVKTKVKTQAPKKTTPVAEVSNNEGDAKAYEQDLQEAILLSKIDFEENREFYKISAQEIEDAKLATKRKKKTKKEQATMSLEEFNSADAPKTNGVPNGYAQMNGTVGKREKMLTSTSETDFFEDVKNVTKKELQRENRKRAKPLLEDEYKIPVDVRLLELQDSLEKMKKEKDKMEGEIVDLKKMNAKLCSLLSDGKTKGKVDALLQVEEHNNVKDGLTHEISDLTIALEQERSKNHSLQQKLLKYQDNRKDPK